MQSTVVAPSAEPDLANVIVPVGSEGGGCATTRVAFADDLFADEVLRFVTAG